MNNITGEDGLDMCVKTVKEKKEVYIGGAYIDRFKLLASVCNAESKKDAWKLLNVISKLFHPLDDETFNTLYGAVAMYTSIRFTKNELSYHLLFEKNYSKIREGKIVKKKTDGLNIRNCISRKINCRSSCKYRIYIIFRIRKCRLNLRSGRTDRFRKCTADLDILGKNCYNKIKFSRIHQLRPACR